MQRLTRNIGRISIALCLGSAALFSAEAATLQVVPSSTEVALDENLSLEFRTTVEGTGGQIGQPQFEAPEFDQVNLYSQSTGIESAYINGQITVKQTQSIMVVLHPKREGKHRVKNIRVRAGTQTLTAPDVEINVVPEGTNTLSQRSRTHPGYIAGGRKTGLPNSGIQQGGDIQNILIRTEPNKIKAFKGEQIILSYALYTRAPVMGIQVERYPTVPGFLKEDLEIPVLGGHLNYSPSVINGKEFHRAVLAQYAIFPVKEGMLPIDPFTAKFTLRGVSRPLLGGDDDEDDPFGVSRMFQAMQPRTVQKSSDRLQIEVLPLPGAGQPADFSGLVGDFSITAVADKNTVKAGEPINLKAKVEGMGHTGNLEKLHIEWPKDFELYEDKSSSTFQKTGFSERIFDYMVIPRVKGKFQIPGIVLSMFNPQSKAYQSRQTPPIDIEVLEGTPGVVYNPKERVAQPVASAQNIAQDIRYWLDGIPGGTSDWRGVTRALALLSLFALLFALVFRWQQHSGALKRMLSLRRKNRIPKNLLDQARRLSTSAADPVIVCNEAEAILTKVLELRFGLQITSLTRAQIRQALLEAKVEDRMVLDVEGLLEKCENARYMPSDNTAFSAERQAIAQQAKAELVRLTEKFLN